MSELLVVEDEKPIAEGIIFNLNRMGHNVDYAEDGRVALDLIQHKKYDLVLLDIRMPDVDGYQVCQKLREQKEYMPVIMLTARDQKEDIIKGLKCGADDYMTKPFDLDELLARVEGMLRRQDWGQKQKNKIEKWEFGSFFVNFSTWEAQTLKGLVILSKKEIDTLKVFYDRQGEVVSREDLLKEVWDLPRHPNTRIVDNVIVSLRKYFEEDSQNPKFIINMRGQGYKFIV